MGKGFLESYWEWLWGDDEEFIDLNKGIAYSAHGKTRSMKGLFTNYGNPNKRGIDEGEAKKILQHLIDRGKVKKEDLIEYMQNK